MYLIFCECVVLKVFIIFYAEDLSCWKAIYAMLNMLQNRAN